jgi:hypothetical protein
VCIYIERENYYPVAGYEITYFVATLSYDNYYINLRDYSNRLRWQRCERRVFCGVSDEGPAMKWHRPYGPQAHSTRYEPVPEPGLVQDQQ